MTPAHVLAHLGPAGDHDDRPLVAVPALAEVVAAHLGRTTSFSGGPFAVADRTAAEHLAVARPGLEDHARAVGEQLTAGHRPVSVNGRCAASLAALPVVLQARPDVVVVWADAHADVNVPGTSATDHLGGMAVSGPLGWWDSGFGAGLTADRVVLVGTRSVDDAEQVALDAAGIVVAAPGPDLVDVVMEAVAGRPVYLHLDCDVLEPGIALSDHGEPGGLDLADLSALAGRLAELEVVGLEIAEWEGPGTASAADLVAALAPLLGSFRAL